MMLHKVITCRDRMWDRTCDKLTVTNCSVDKLFHYGYVNWELLWNSQSELKRFGDWEAEENGTDEGKGKLRKDRVWSGCSHYRGRRSDFCARDLDFEHILDARSPGDHRVQVWSQSSHLSRSRSDLRKKFTNRRTDGQTTDAARLY